MALDPVGEDDLFESFMGPTGKGMNGMEAGGVGWVFRKSWAGRAGLKKVAKAERVVTVSVDTTGGPLELHSIYSQNHGDITLGALREGVWFEDVNDNGPLAREAWKSSFRSLGNRLVLNRIMNRIGGFSECPTRYPRGNQKGSPSNIDIIAMKAMSVARLSAKCVAVGGETHLVAGLTDHRPVVCELEVKHRKARVVERKFKWNMRQVEKDPMLKQVFNHKLQVASVRRGP